MHLELNEGPTDFDVPHNFIVSGHGAHPAHRWLERQLGGARAERHALHADERQRRPGSERHPGRAAGGRDYTGNGADPYTVKDYKSQRNGARGPGFFSLDMRLGYRLQPAESSSYRSCSPTSSTSSNHVNFANPTGNQASAEFLLLTAYSTSYTPRKVQLGARFEF